MQQQRSLPGGARVPSVFVLLSAAALTGCDNQSATHVAVKEASRTVEATGQQTSTTDGFVKGVTGATGGLGDVNANGSAGEKSAAALLTSQAGLATGEQAAADAQQAEANIRRALSRISDLTTQWSAHSAIAITANDFDPSAQIQGLEQAVAAKNQELNAARTRHAELSDRAEGLLGQAQAKAGESRTHLDRAGALLQQAAEKTARDGVPLVEEAARIRNQGERIRIEGEQFQAQHDVLAPQVTEAQALVQQLEAQIAKFGEAQQALRQRREAAGAQAQDARNRADQTAAELDGFVNQSLAAYSEDYNTAFEKARSSFEKAVSAAKQAAGTGADAFTSGKLAAGNAQLSLASLVQGRAALADAMAATLTAAASVEPPLPQRAAYLSKADELRSARATLLEEAAAALEGAQSSFSSVNVRGNQGVKERLDRLAELIGKSRPRSPETPAGETAAPASSADAATPAATDTAAADGVDQGAKDAFAGLVNALKNARWDTVSGYFDTSSDTGKTVARMIAESGPSGARADAAMKAKFGKSLVEAMETSANPMLKASAQQQKQMDFRSIDLAGVAYEAAGSSVYAKAPGREPIELVKTDEGWKVSLAQIEQQLAMIPGGPATVEKMSAGMNAATDAWAARIEAGEFPDADAALNAYMAAIQAEMMKAMQPPAGVQPGGGGG